MVTNNKLNNLLIYLTLVIFTLTMSIALTINFPGLLKLNLFFQDNSNFEIWTKNQVNEDFSNLMSYLNNPFQRKLIFDNLYFSNKGENHFKDVKYLFQLNYFFLISSSIALFWQKRKKLLFQGDVKRKSKKIRLFVTAFSILAVLLFEKALIIFHRLFFTNTDWIFNYQTDPIILFLPENFFLFCFLLIISISILLLSIIPNYFSRKEFGEIN